MPKPFKAAPDPRGGHIRLYWDIFDSPAFMALGNSDRSAYMALMRQRGKTNNGDISLTIKYARRFADINSETTLAKCLRALCAVGLIAVTRDGGSSHGGQRLPTLYRFTDAESYPFPGKFVEGFKATNEWKTLTSIAAAKAAIKKIEDAAGLKAADKKLKSALQKMELTTPKNEVVEPLTTPKNGVWTPRPLQKMELGNPA
jgi:hypothetical protein